MVNNIWNLFKIWIANHTSHSWVENHLLYFAILFLVTTFIQLIIIFIKWQNDIKRIDKETQKSIIKLMRETSEKRKKERKQLKF